jgi:hypothetical protein
LKQWWRRTGVSRHRLLMPFLKSIRFNLTLIARHFETFRT